VGKSACGFGNFDDLEHRKLCLACQQAAGEFPSAVPFAIAALGIGMLVLAVVR
jgi:hypothetical protein